MIYYALPQASRCRANRGRSTPLGAVRAVAAGAAVAAASVRSRTPWTHPGTMWVDGLRREPTSPCWRSIPTSSRQDPVLGDLVGLSAVAVPLLDLKPALGSVAVRGAPLWVPRTAQHSTTPVAAAERIVDLLVEVREGCPQRAHDSLHPIGARGREFLRRATGALREGPLARPRRRGDRHPYGDKRVVDARRFRAGGQVASPCERT